MAVKEKPSSFSRQTTWEGIDTASAAFSRGTSLASAWDPLPDRTAGVPPPLPELSEWQVQVKNTFIEKLPELGSEWQVQTTWEGIETTPGGFSRATSLGSEIEVMGTPSRTRQELGEWQVQVKNTFIEVSDSDGSETEQDQGVLRRARSMPLF
eukprot:g13287.t1